MERYPPHKALVAALMPVVRTVADLRMDSVWAMDAHTELQRHHGANYMRRKLRRIKTELTPDKAWWGIKVRRIGWQEDGDPRGGWVVLFPSSLKYGILCDGRA